MGDIDLDALERPTGPRGLCHLDYRPSNLIAHSDRDPVLVDFDDMAYASLCSDLGVAL